MSRLTTQGEEDLYGKQCTVPGGAEQIAGALHEKSVRGGCLGYFFWSVLFCLFGFLSSLSQINARDFTKKGNCMMSFAVNHRSRGMVSTALSSSNQMAMIGKKK